MTAATIARVIWGVRSAPDASVPSPVELNTMPRGLGDTLCVGDVHSDGGSSLCSLVRHMLHCPLRLMLRHTLHSS